MTPRVSQPVQSLNLVLMQSQTAVRINETRLLVLSVLLLQVTDRLLGRRLEVLTETSQKHEFNSLLLA